ncbi:lipopolysaccharide export system permease protein [Malonomonas rubra DSM 5091]|uniref:Lipopolysaccharide export system permease protein n=1 Tax=Malonomonas rubra DSM 5091 TaxID=1122189 RepID=A0A1M6BR56_MALRU|nr:LPS export ABC transporter permease LptF [Malonomonas rubra]SHI51186.1 lipopolysaccharide export system permease protein [Malonomonas rubra DSM 5091]
MSILRIHRYIIKEISTPALLSLFIFTFVILMGRIPRLTELVINKGVPLFDIVQLFAYMLPNFFSITVPLSFLLGILLAFGRLSADSEFIALKASGVSLYMLLKPVIVMAVCFSLLTGWLTISAKPAGKRAFSAKLFQIASSQASVGIRPGIFNDDFDGLVLYTREMNDRDGIMRGVFISDEREGETPTTIVARQGRFIPDPNNYTLTLRLNNGTIHRSPNGEKKLTYQTIGFTSYDINLATNNETGEQPRVRRSSMSWSQLNEAYKENENAKSRLKLSVEKHERLSVAFAPLVLALVGVPLGLQSTRSGKGAGFAMALAISLVYYLLLSINTTLASRGFIPPVIALWFPNVFFLIGGSYFLHCTAVERQMVFLSWPSRILAKFKRKPGGRS